MSVFNFIKTKLPLQGHLSRPLAVVAALVIGATTGQAHEVLPTIAQVSTTADAVRVEMRMNAEAFVAGINLDGLQDTNSSDKSDDYDALRALAPDQMSDRLRAAWPEISNGVAVTGNGAEIPLTLDAIEVSEVGNVELARPTRVILSGALPSDAQTLQFSWPEGHGTLALRQTGVEDGYAAYLEGGETSEPFAIGGGTTQSGWQAFLSYIPVGFDHILPKGLDHILFVLGLFFLSPKLGPLLWQVSAFTLAHTVTLALGALGLVNVPGSIVEPLIAASIAFIAIENMFSTNLHRWRPVVVFAFGLLHGLGFASVLQEFGLPQAQFIPALIGFNVGVELGQLTVIALAFLAVGAWFRHKTWYRSGIAIPASAVIACVGIYWAVERTFL